MDDTTTPAAEDERLSLRGLLEEPLLASARLLSGTDALSGPVTWCLPWGEVLSRPDSLAEVAVYTRPETLSAHGRELESLVARAPTRRREGPRRPRARSGRPDSRSWSWVFPSGSPHSTDSSPSAHSPRKRT